MAKGKENKVRILDGGKGDVEGVTSEVVSGLEEKVNGAGA